MATPQGPYAENRVLDNVRGRSIVPAALRGRKFESKLRNHKKLSGWLLTSEFKLVNSVCKIKKDYSLYLFYFQALTTLNFKVSEKKYFSTKATP